MTSSLPDGINVRVNRWLKEWDVYMVDGVIECGSVAPGLMAFLEREQRRADAWVAFTAMRPVPPMWTALVMNA